MIVAVEDELLKSLALVIARSVGISVTSIMDFKGKENLRLSANKYNNMARGFPVLMIADLDSAENCPADLRESWIAGHESQFLILRFAVLEAESWVMADPGSLADFLRIPKNKIPADPNVLDYPKETLVNLARRSRNRKIREGIVPPLGSTAKVGPEYNFYLYEFVTNSWSIDVASQRCKSLRKTISRLNEVKEVFDRSQSR